MVQKICKNCKYYVNNYGEAKDKGQCYGQKDAPQVDDNECCEDFKSNEQTDTTEDLVIRNLIIDDINKQINFFDHLENEGKLFNGMANPREILYGLYISKTIVENAVAVNSSVESLKGEWIELPKAYDSRELPCKCSLCGHVLSFMNYYPKSNFCPHCGADMRGGKE